MSTYYTNTGFKPAYQPNSLVFFYADHSLHRGIVKSVILEYISDDKSMIQWRIESMVTRKMYTLHNTSGIWLSMQVAMEELMDTHWKVEKDTFDKEDS